MSAEMSELAAVIWTAMQTCWPSTSFPMVEALPDPTGDMVIDTNDVLYFNNSEDPSFENRFLSNILMHEGGHGVGLDHVIPEDGTKLMEATISNSPSFFGPQHDDILGAQRLYGDTFENDDSNANPHVLGELKNETLLISGDPEAGAVPASIDHAGDDDWFQFDVPTAGNITVALDPRGEIYQIGPEGGTAVEENSADNLDLSFEIVDAAGNVSAIGQ